MSTWLSAEASKVAFAGTSLRSTTVRAQVCWFVTLFLAVQIHCVSADAVAGASKAASKAAASRGSRGMTHLTIRGGGSSTL